MTENTKTNIFVGLIYILVFAILASAVGPKIYELWLAGDIAQAIMRGSLATLGFLFMVVIV